MGKMKDLAIEAEEQAGKAAAEEVESHHPTNRPPRPSKDKQILSLLSERVKKLEAKLKAEIEEKNRILSYHNGLYSWTEKELLTEIFWRLELGKDDDWGLSDNFLERVHALTGQELFNRDLRSAQEHREETLDRAEKILARWGLRIEEPK